VKEIFGRGILKTRPIYYDTETTGLSSKNDRIIEIAAYDPYLKKNFQSLINPKMPIPLESQKICNITDEMVADSPTFDEVTERFIKFASGNTILIAHNNDSFDIHFLKEEFKRANKNMPEWRFIDSLKWARKYRKDLPKHSLQYLREIYNIEKNQAHRALDDVIVLEKVFSSMIDDLDFETVYKLLNEKEVALMPFGKHRGIPLKDVPKSYVIWLSKSGAFDKPQNRALGEKFEKLGILRGR
jgi:DNA polymerase-3 subunit epsilon